MAFAEKKFRSLRPANQAKKIADLLATGAGATDPVKFQRCVAEAARLSAFTRPEPGGKAPGLNIAPTEDDGPARRKIYEAYLYWRDQAGLGPEADVLRNFNRQAEDASEQREVKARRADRSAPDDSDPDEIRSSSTFDYAVWLHDIRSGHNVGAVIRTAECFGFRRVYLSGFTPGPQQRSVQSAAMGCEEWIECRRLSNPEPAAFAPEISSEDPPALVVLESPNVVLPAKARRREIVCYTEYAWPAAAVLVVGNEELGVSQEVLSQADAIVTIPMYGRKASLNLASSFAIAAARARESRRE